MKRLLFAGAILAWLLGAPGLAREPEPGPSPDVPELAALSGYVGSWDSQSEIQPIAGITEGGTLKGSAQAEWIHGGRFVRQTWTIEADGTRPAMSGSAIMTYDPAKKRYRAWSFVSNGTTSVGEGQYDEASRTFTWQSRDENDYRTVTRASFAEAGVENWSIDVTDPNGRLVSGLRGKNVLRKR